MTELAKRLVGKNCEISIFGDVQVVIGTIREVVDHALLVERIGRKKAPSPQIINLDCVLRIQEIPLKEK